MMQRERACELTIKRSASGNGADERQRGGHVTQPRQPFLHDLTILVAAPSQVFSREDGDIGRADGPVGVEGLWHADLRVLSGLTRTVDGRPPEHIATRSLPADESGDGLLFTYLLP